ncbi:hypothetical protein A9R00_10875, partial [Oleispira antarctica]
STTKKENTVPIPNAISSKPLETNSDMLADPYKIIHLPIFKHNSLPKQAKRQANVLKIDHFDKLNDTY